ncbi:hypothetical protein J2W97_005230 [Paenibacillus jamilae]|jgi:hypothetical protein|nr:hypothetical protein [Paenibacillus jamilae]SEK08439.1 hypothetical protein SAMN04488600_11342 [Paenibacillus polymyxa]
MSHTLFHFIPTVKEIQAISFTVGTFHKSGILHHTHYFKFHINVIIRSIYSRYMHYD